MDRIAVIEKETLRAGDKLSEMETSFPKSNLSFLKESGFIKIRDRVKEPYFAIYFGIVLAKISVLAGIKAEIDDLNKADISRMLSNKYANLSVEDVWKAFELERHGEYAERTDHFQLFNAEYVSSVLNKFKKWKSDSMISLNITSKTKEEEHSKYKLTPEEIFESENRQVIRSYQSFKDSGNPHPIVDVFDTLYQRGLIEANNSQDRSEYFASLMKEAESILKEEAKTLKPDRLKYKEVIQDLESKNSSKVIVKAQQLALRDYFREIDMNDVDLSKELTKTKNET